MQVTSSKINTLLSHPQLIKVMFNYFNSFILLFFKVLLLMSNRILCTLYVIRNFNVLIRNIIYELIN